MSNKPDMQDPPEYLVTLPMDPVRVELEPIQAANMTIEVEPPQAASRMFSLEEPVEYYFEHCVIGSFSTTKP